MLTRGKIVRLPGAFVPDAAAAPMAFGTAHSLISAAGVGSASRLLIVGSGGPVGMAALRLARVRGADVTVAGPGDAPPFPNVDAVIDLEPRDDWRRLLDLLRPGGSYARRGAIADPERPGERRRVEMIELSPFCHPHPRREVFAGFISIVTVRHLRALPSIYASKEPAK